MVGPLAAVAVAEDAALRSASFGSTDAAVLLLRDEEHDRTGAAAALTPVTMGYMLADLILLNQWSLAGQAGKTEGCNIDSLDQYLASGAFEGKHKQSAAASNGSTVWQHPGHK